MKNLRARQSAGIIVALLEPIFTRGSKMSEQMNEWVDEIALHLAHETATAIAHAPSELKTHFASAPDTARLISQRMSAMFARPALIPADVLPKR